MPYRAVKRRRRWPAALAAALLALLAYFALWPVPLEPAAWEVPAAPSLTGPYAPNQALLAVDRLPVGPGPEDVAVDAEGRLYAGLLDGRIVRLAAEATAGSSVETFARTGGRPLGLRFAPDGRLIVADAVRGLLAVDREGRVETLSTEQGGEPYRLTDDLDIGRDGVVYFTDASSRFGLGDSVVDLLTHQPLGRLLAYDPRRSATRLLLGGLYFANGVALAPDESFVLVVETGTYRLRRYWLQGPRAGTSDVFADNLPAIPDGVSSNGRDTFWVSLVAPRDALLDGSHPHPWMKKALLRLPAFLRPGPKRYGFVLGLDLEGHVVHNLQDPSGSTFALVTNAVEHAGRLYLGTLSDEAVGRLNLPARTTALGAAPKE